MSGFRPVFVSCGRRARRGGGGGATGEASPQAMSRRHCRMLPQGNATIAGFVVARSARFAGFTINSWIVCDVHFLRMQIFAIIRVMSRQMIYPDECYAIRGAVYEVYRELGSGFREEVYQQWLRLTSSKLGLLVNFCAYPKAVVEQWAG